MDDTLQKWESWKKSPTKDNLYEILHDLDPIIMKRVNMFNTAEIPKEALTTKAKILTIEALDNYDPSKSALNTHTYNYLRKLSRYVGENQNVGKIPENRIRQITVYKSAVNELSDELDREPSFQELSEKLKWPVEEIHRMDAELRNTTASSIFEGDIISSALSSDRTSRVIRNIYYELSPEEARVYEYLMGAKGKQQLSETEIAKKLGMSIPKVSRIKHKIHKKIEQYL